MATLIAIFLLTEFSEEFPEKKAEWSVLIKKAKDYLTRKGVDKLDKFLNKIDFTLNWILMKWIIFAYISLINTASA